MSRPLTASDRSRLIKLARSLPKGSGERRAILAGLKHAYGRDREDEALKLGLKFGAIPDVRFFNVQGYIWTYKELSDNLVRLGNTTDPAFSEGDRQDLVDEIKRGLKALRAMKAEEQVSHLKKVVETVDHWVPHVEKLLRMY